MSNQGDSDEEQEGLTKEEEAKCWEAFSAFDKDSSGYIDANELRIVLEMMGQKTTEEEIFRMIAEADAENTGEISYAQFKHVISEQKKNPLQSVSACTATAHCFTVLLDDGRKTSLLLEPLQLLLYHFQDLYMYLFQTN